MVEGGSSSDYRHVKTMLYDRPDLMHHILSVTADSVTAYLNAQVESGARALMIFDSWGGSLSRGVPRVFARLHAAHRCRADSREGRRAHSGHRIYQGRRFVAGALPVAAATRSVSTGRSTWAKRVVVSAMKLRCKAISTGIVRLARGGGCRGQESARLRRRQYRSRFQHGARHFPIHPAGKCECAGRLRYMPIAAPCASKKLLHSS